MPDIFEVDGAGSDVFDRDFSIAVVYNNNKKYGYRFQKHLQDQITYNHRSEGYCIKNKKSLKPRVYAAIVILLLKKISKKEKINKDYKFLICEDLFGHFNQICDLLVQHLKKEFLNLDKKRHIAKCRHAKKSLIQETAHNIYKGNLDGIDILNVKLDEIEKVLSKCRPIRI